MRIWLSTAPLAFRLKGAGGGTVDNRNRQGLHLRNPKTCPNKPGHLYPTPQTLLLPISPSGHGTCPMHFLPS
jgi:hypothetical protein